MNAQQLQALIAINANRIAGMQMNADDHKMQATYDRSNGDVSFAADETAKARKLLTGAAMRKATALQRDLKAELAGIHRDARIARKMELLGDCVDLNGIDVLTSVEQEDILDKLAIMFIPKKPDSRIQPEKAAA